MKRSRSPKYPSMSLPEAIDRVRKIHVPERTNPIARETAAQHIGYSGISGAADQALGTLIQFGLIERVGTGEVRASQLAVDILHPASETSRAEALEISARHSPVFRDLMERYPPEHHISETALRSHLVREGFFDRAISAVIKAYTQTAAFLLAESDRNAPQDNDLGATENGDGKTDGLPAPENRSAAATTASAPLPNTGQTVSKLTQHAPGLAGNPAEGMEQEWFRMRAGRDAEVRILISGAMTPRGLGHLITLLTAQKEILEEEEEFFKRQGDPTAEEEPK